MQFGSKQKAKIELCAAMCYFAFVAPYCCCRCVSFLSPFFMVLSQACDLLCLYVSNGCAMKMSTGEIDKMDCKIPTKRKKKLAK